MENSVCKDNKWLDARIVCVVFVGGLTIGHPQMDSGGGAQSGSIDR